MPTLVLGAHRSGTSALTAAASSLGLSVGASRMMPTHPTNPRGFWEVQALTALNDDVLAALGGDWRRPPSALSRDLWWRSPLLAQVRERAGPAIRGVFPSDPWVWKDPRNCLTLPFWLDLMPGRPVVLYVYRHPLEVRDSLVARERMSGVEALAVWELNVRVSLRQLDALAVCVVRHRDLMDDPTTVLRRVHAFLRSHSVDVAELPRGPVTDLVDRSLTHWRSSPADLEADAEATDAQKRLFRTLEGVNGDHDRFAGMPLTLPDWQGPFEVLERGAYRQELARLQAEHASPDHLRELRRSLETSRLRAAELETRVCALERELETRRTPWPVRVGRLALGGARRLSRRLGHPGAP